MSTNAATVLATLEDPEVGAVGTLWVHLQLVEPGSATPRRSIANGRDHPDAVVGRSLLIADASWRIVSVERQGRGRMTLRLEL